MAKKIIAYGLMCDCGCADPLVRAEDHIYALFKNESDAKKAAENYGCNKIGKFEVTFLKEE